MEIRQKAGRTNVGVPYALPGAGAAQGDLVQQRHVVAHNCRLAYDDACRVVHEDAATYAGGRVDVHVQHF
jgi:hypothetical protein